MGWDIVLWLDAIAHDSILADLATEDSPPGLEEANSHAVNLPMKRETRQEIAESPYDIKVAITQQPVRNQDPEPHSHKEMNSSNDHGSLRKYLELQKGIQFCLDLDCSLNEMLSGKFVWAV